MTTGPGGGTGTRAVELIFAELRKAEAKFPGWPDDPIHGAGILCEESGEAMQAALDYYYGRTTDTDRLKKEVAQAGAMAIRLLVSIFKGELIRDSGPGPSAKEET